MGTRYKGDSTRRLKALARNLAGEEGAFFPFLKEDSDASGFTNGAMFNPYSVGNNLVIFAIIPTLVAALVSAGFIQVLSVEARGIPKSSRACPPKI